MPVRPPMFRPRNMLSRDEQRREHDQRRTEAQPWRHWYWTARWKRRRADQLGREPLCERCLAIGIVTPATVAHHVTPHRGDQALFWDSSLESVCQPCHDRDIQRDERRADRRG